MRFFGFLLAALVLSAGLSAPVAAQSHRRKGHRHSSGKSAGQLKNKLHQMRSQRAAIRKQLRQTKHQSHVVAEDLHVVDARLERIVDELDRTTKRLSDSRAEQRELATRLAAATKRLEQVKGQVRRRIADMYMRRQTTFLSALAGTRSVNDLLTRQQILEAIAKYDHQLFVEYRSLRQEIDRKKRRQDELVASIRGLRSDQIRQQGNLRDTREEKGQVLESLRAKQGELQRMLAQYDADMSSIESEIAAFARRVRRPGEKQLPAQFIGRFLKPAHGPITSGFGMRYHPILHFTRPHNGIDIGAPAGSPIVAAADGEVIKAGYSRSFGNMVIIAHGGGLSTVYAHASRLYVSTGQSVRRGQQIAAVGSTGLAKGPHLHWEVHVGKRAVNPMGRF
ncbi:peptidase M23B [Fimbriimonas ginsengisoli Gsoil 348]|uniref:Peptidase M23B n=2 Tax=Fimbriimonas ginsengisoli TaxID=1005039 RepID=A0A068NKJ1_FIMGI|nr:peptidase M23B [Fimbriimonas ginsengisoli Gsoil 348]